MDKYCEFSIESLFFSTKNLHHRAMPMFPQQPLVYVSWIRGDAVKIPIKGYTGIY